MCLSVSVPKCCSGRFVSKLNRSVLFTVFVCVRLLNSWMWSGGSFGLSDQGWLTFPCTSFFCFRIIYKCSMCDTVFTLQTLLYRHFDQHIENQKVSVFKCPDCSLLYAQKQLMMDHIKVRASPLSFQGAVDANVGRKSGLSLRLRDSTSGAVEGRGGHWSLLVSSWRRAAFELSWLRDAFYSRVLACISQKNQSQVTNACPDCTKNNTVLDFFIFLLLWKWWLWSLLFENLVLGRIQK